MKKKGIFQIQEICIWSRATKVQFSSVLQPLGLNCPVQELVQTAKLLVNHKTEDLLENRRQGTRFT